MQWVAIDVEWERSSDAVGAVRRSQGLRSGRKRGVPGVLCADQRREQKYVRRQRGELLFPAPINKKPGSAAGCAG